MGSLTFFHVPNGGRRGKAEGAIFKAMGVRAGVADLVLLFPSGRCAFIEIKSPKGRLSPAQKVFRNTVEDMGFPFAECRGVDEVERFVRGILVNHEYRDRADRAFQPEKVLGLKPDLHRHTAA